MFQYVNEWYLPPNVIERAPLYDITDIYPLAPLNELPYMALLAVHVLPIAVKMLLTFCF